MLKSQFNDWLTFDHNQLQLHDLLHNRLPIDIFQNIMAFAGLWMSKGSFEHEGYSSWLPEEMASLTGFYYCIRYGEADLC